MLSDLSVKCLLTRGKHDRAPGRVLIGRNRAGVNEPTTAFTRTRSSDRAGVHEPSRGKAQLGRELG